MELDFNRFTDIARQTISKAYQIAREENTLFVEPQMVMIAVMQEGREMVYYILQKLNVDKAAFFQSVGESLESIPQDGNGQPNLSPSLLSSLTKAQQLAAQTGSQVVALEHIFWAFGTEPGAIRDIMDYYHITEDELENAVAMYRNGGASTGDADIEDGDIPTLSQYARDMNKDAEEGLIEPVIGRDAEIRRLLQVLARKTKNNPVLVGPPGTGKTAIAEGLAYRLKRGDVPRDLSGIRIYSLDLTALNAGAGYAGQLEERLKKIIAETRDNGQIVLFIDEIHMLLDGNGAMNAANILKPAMARGEIKIIGAITTDEYAKYIEKDKALERRLQRIDVCEPDLDSAITILRGIKSRFERHHRIKILDEAIVAAVRLSARYITNRFLPDKALDLIDEAASKMKIERSSVPLELDNLSRLVRSKEIERESLRQDEQDHDLTELEREIANLREQENVLSATWQNERVKLEQVQTLQDQIAETTTDYEQEVELGMFEDALRHKRVLDDLKQELRELTSEMESNNNTLLKVALDEDDIRAIITANTGIPVSKMDEDETTKLVELENILHKSVIGQEEAVHTVSEVIKRNRMGFGDANRPIGSFLFLGTTGVGKTELSKALAGFLFDSPEMLVRIDMSEYQQEHSVSRLFGAPPGYVGYDQGGQLTEAIRRKPYCVVLLDEVEKAHKKVFETLLQVLDDGRMTDGKGNVVNFKNTIIIMTSNMGAEIMNESITDDGILNNEAGIQQHILTLLKRQISPEFVNRIDEIVMFKPLNRDNIREIVQLQLRKQQSKLANSGITISFSADVVALITELGFDPTMGARPVKRVINNYVINPLTDALLMRMVTTASPIAVTVSNGNIKFSN